MSTDPTSDRTTEDPDPSGKRQNSKTENFNIFNGFNVYPVLNVFLRGLLVLTVAWPLLTRWHEQIHAPLSHPDEAAWIFYTYYYGLSPKNPAWQDELAYHHPPLARSIFGAALATHGLNEHTLENFRWQQEHDYDYADEYWKQFQAGMSQRVSPPALVITRSVATLFALLACGAIFVLGREINLSVGIVAALLLAWSPLLHSVVALGEAETILLFFLVCSVWLAVRLGKKLTETPPKTLSLDLAAVTWAAGCTLAFSIKILGLLGWIIGMVGLGVTVLLLPSPKRRWRGGILLLCGTLLFLGLTIWLNPTLWPHPLANLAHYFSFRTETMILQREFGFWNVFESWNTRCAYYLRDLFFDGDFFWSRLRLPLGFVFFCCGTVAVIREIRQHWLAPKIIPAVFLLAGLALAGAATLFSFFIHWVRYLLPILPWVKLLEAVGFVALFGVLWEKAAHGKNRWLVWREQIRNHQRQGWILGVTTVLLTLFFHSPIFPPISHYTLPENDFLKAFTLLQSTLKRHPHNRTYRVELAITYQQLGDRKKAREQWEILARPDPAEEFRPCNEGSQKVLTDALAAFPNDDRIRTEADRYQARCAPPGGPAHP